MAEANLIPGATQLFAEVLEGGDVKKLFDNMKKGKYELQDIVKVLEMLGKKLDQDLLDKMLQRPTAELAELQTATQRFFQTLNESGGLTLMRKGLDAITWTVNGLTKVLKPLINIFQNLWSHTKDLYNLVASFSGLLGGIFFKNTGATILTMTLLGLVFKSFGATVLRILPLVGKHAGMLSKIAPAATKAALALSFLWKKMLIPTAVVSGFLLIEDLIFALRGQGSVLRDLAKDGEGWSSVLAKILLTIGSIVKFSMGLGFSIFDALFGDGNYIFEVLDTFRAEMNDLFPFDRWMYQMKQLGSLMLAMANIAINPTDVTAYTKLYKEYSSFKGSGQYFDQMLKYNPASAAMAPASIARQSSGSTNTYQTTIEINGTGLDPKQIADEVTRQFTTRLNSAAASRSNLVMRPM